MDTRKVLSVSKLSLVLVLLFVFIKTVLIPVRINEMLGPAVASGEDDGQKDEIMCPTRSWTEDYAQIIATDLFGTSNKTVGRGRSSIDASGLGVLVPEELGLVLLGTVSGNSEVARAIIKNLKTGAHDLYKTGQVVGDARIEAIEADAVILLHNGETKALYLTSWRPNTIDNSHMPKSNANFEKIEVLKTDLPDEKTGMVVPARNRNVQKLLTKTIIEPYLVNGQIEGLKITGLEGLARGKNFGLKNGDVIRTVNGHRLTSKQKAFQILKKARSQDTLTTELLRADRLNKLSWALR